MSDYRNKVGDFSNESGSESIWTTVESADPLEWWKNLDFDADTLAEVATHLLQIPSNLCTLTLPSSFDPKLLFASSSNSNSSLGEDTLEKLALVRHYTQNGLQQRQSKINPAPAHMQIQVRSLNQQSSCMKIEKDDGIIVNGGSHENQGISSIRQIMINNNKANNSGRCQT